MTREEQIEAELKKPETWDLARRIYNVGSGQANHLTWMVATALALNLGRGDVPDQNPSGTVDEWMQSFVDLAKFGTDLPEL